jgi:tripartite-type tricarboxylate transporter receptor subunit TctC
MSKPVLFAFAAAGAFAMSGHPFSIAVLGVSLAAGAAAMALAQGGAGSFPDHPIRIIVSVPAGGGVDSVTRMVADKMREPLGQPLIVENKAGAAGSVAAELVFGSAPDGYTLLASQPAPITTNAFLYKSLNYDPAKLTPVAIMSHIPNVLLVRENFPAKTVQEFIAYAKANPGKLNYASQGIGTTSHLTAELFQSLTGTKLVHVPYKGTAPALNDLLAGNVDVFFNELATSVELHKAGKARLLAVLTDKRVPTVPDIPTMAEAGVPGCESDTWNALTAPPNTPAPIVAKLNDAVNKAMKAPDLLDHFSKINLAPGGGSSAEMAALLKQETKRWGDVIHAAGIEPQ